MTFALADCNNFYVSCERAFDPSLKNRPVIVLSSNDGCVVSRSQEAKDLGITMGLPLFKAQHLIRDHGIKVLSSNYALYGSMSRRVMAIMAGFGIEREIYSIDEAFLHLRDAEDIDHTSLCISIRQRILKWTGIPVSIGIGQTKTIAKMANRLVKMAAVAEGVVNLTDQESLEQALPNFPVEEIWGVGHRIRRTLNAHGIHTARDLRNADTFWMKKEFGIKGLALTLELRGHPCNEMQDAPAQRKQIIVSRTFGRRLSTFDQLAPAFAEFARHGAERLNKAGLAAKSLTAFVETDRFQPDAKGGSSVQLDLESPISDAENLVWIAQQALAKILQNDHEYKKGGIILEKLAAADLVQESLFDAGLSSAKNADGEVHDDSRRTKLLHMLSTINQKHSGALVQRGMSTENSHWEQRREFLSPRYTTNWDELPRVH